MILVSRLTREEALKKISSVTAPDICSRKPGHQFVGTLTENSFRIQLMIHYSSNDRIRPEISGVVSDREGGSDIQVNFKWPNGWKQMAILVLIFNVLAIGIIAFVPGVPEILASKWWVPILFLLLTGGIFYVTFRARVYESIRILKKLLNAEQAS